MVFIFIEVGAIIGTLVLGRLSDICYWRRTPILFISLLLWTISCCLYIDIPNESSISWLYLLSFVIGLFSESSFNIFASVVSVDISKQYYETKHHKATSTISAFILASGSFGKAIGLITILTVGAFQLKNNFYIFMSAWYITSSIIIIRYFIEDVRGVLAARKYQPSSKITIPFI